MNDRIRAHEVRVIYEEVSEVLPTRRALELAKKLGLDRVEVAPNARPPVCKIVEFGKWKYDQSKQKKDKKPKTKEKEVKFRVNIGQHDYDIKMTRAEDFLVHGFKIRIQLQFRGRQNAHKDLGFVLMERVKVDLAGVAQVDLEPKLNNRNILMMMSPLPEGQQKRKYRQDDDEDYDLDEHDMEELAESAENGDDDDDDHDDHDDDETEASEDESAEASAEEAKDEQPK